MHSLRSDRFLRARRAVQAAGALLILLGIAGEISGQTRLRTPDKGVIGYGFELVFCFRTTSSKIHSRLMSSARHDVTPRVSACTMLVFANPGL